MSNNVLQHQETFVAKILSEQPLTNSRFDKGLYIYRKNLQATATQALSITYPTLAVLVGNDLMGKIAHSLLLKQPPHIGDWAEWGVGLPNFLTSLEVIEEYPFIAEVARMDLAIHQSERATQQMFLQESAFLMQEKGLDNVGILINDSVHTFSTSYPIIQIKEVADHDNKQSSLALLNKLDQGQTHYNILVYRPQYKAQVVEISDSELTWLTLLVKQISIGKALELVSDFDFTQWLTQALSRNLIKAFISLN
ncbi:putative DNA-binding domain-containing protein [Thalassotalea marina]